MKILVVEPGCKPVAMEIDGTIETMGKIVGGQIQAMYPAESVALVYNENGNVLHLPPNRGVLDDKGEFLDIVCGTFFLCGAPEDSYSSTQMSMPYRKYFRIWVAVLLFCLHKKGQNKKTFDTEGAV